MRLCHVTVSYKQHSKSSCTAMQLKMIKIPGYGSRLPQNVINYSMPQGPLRPKISQKIIYGLSNRAHKEINGDKNVICLAKVIILQV